MKKTRKKHPPVSEIVIISGPSGSGKFSALKIFEDIGFYVIDNLPAGLFPDLLRLVRQVRTHPPVAVVMDARNPNFILRYDHYQTLAKNLGFRLRILYLETQDIILLRRFSETRRRHPLSPFGNLQEGIRKERELLQPIKQRANHVLDTSHLTVHNLKELLLKMAKVNKKPRRLPINIVTFGYRHGLPLDADLVFDIRFLPNPFFEPALKRLSGKDRPVQRFLLRRLELKRFRSLLLQFLQFTLGHYQREGKTYLTLAFGCTGGRHRSVMLGEIIVKDLKKWGYSVSIMHRDIDKDYGRR